MSYSGYPLVRDARVLPLCNNAVGVIYSPSRLINSFLWVKQHCWFRKSLRRPVGIVLTFNWRGNNILTMLFFVLWITWWISSFPLPLFNKLWVYHKYQPNCLGQYNLCRRVRPSPPTSVLILHWTIWWRGSCAYYLMHILLDLWDKWLYSCFFEECFFQYLLKITKHPCVVLL